MTDLELLFVVLAVIYLWECACWIPRGTIAFLSWTGATWHWAAGSASVGNQRGGFVFAIPIPPLGSILTANPLPVSITADAVLGYVSTAVDPAGRPRQTGKLARFDQIKKIECVGRKLSIDGALFASAASAQHAGWLAEKLRELGKAKARAREAMIGELFDDTLDDSKIERTWTEFKKNIEPLRYLTNGVFCYLFIFAPLIIYEFGLHKTWLRLLIGLFILTFSAAILFHRVHKLFYPKAEDDRFTHFLITMLSPATTPRAHDVLSRPLFQCFHPLAVAKVFCPKNEFKAFAQRVLLDMRNPALPLIPADNPGIKKAESASRTIWQSQVEKFLARAGLDLKELASPPPKLEPSMYAYCPRCLAQFTKETTKCGDCGGLELARFP